MNYTMGRSAAAALLAGILAGCGGGSGDGGDVLAGGDTSSGSGNPIPASSCPAGVAACSGSGEISRTGMIKLTASGVQTLMTSTNDLLATPRARGADATIVYGLAPTATGLAEIRVARADGGPVTGLNLLLSELGISWDGRSERPPVIETFGLSRSRVTTAAQGLATLAPLPAASDTAFWNNSTTTFAGTQSNYANNIYFARQPSTGHCAAGDADCVTAAGNGLRLTRGDWSSGGLRPDEIIASRLHEDGATLAPDQIPFAGFKGYRDIWAWSYRYAHLGGWVSKDTVDIVEWGGTDEHNKARRGVLAFGDVTPVTALPTTGTARYVGYARGWYSPDGRIDPYPIAADVEILVDFAARSASFRLLRLRVDEAQNPSPQLAASSENTLPFASPANYLVGTVAHGDASGHAGARFFGPVTNGAPAEMAGSFSVRGTPGSGSPIVDAVFGAGGFIAKQATP
jgi:hypothetical protein